MKISNINYGEARKIKHLYYEFSTGKDYKTYDGKRLVISIFYFLNDNFEQGCEPVIWKNFIGINITFAWIIKFSIFR